MEQHEWRVANQKSKDGTTQYYCYLSDENDRKYSTWYYEPFETLEKAQDWIRQINFGRISFNTTSLTRTKF